MRTGEWKDIASVCTALVFALVLAFVACALPTSVVNECAWGDEVEDELISDIQEDGETAGDQDALAGPGGIPDDEEPAGESGDASGPAKLSDEERHLMEGLAALEARLDEELGELETAKANFDAVHAGIARGVSARDAVLGAGKDAAKRMEELDRRRLGVLARIRTVQEELMQSDEFGVKALMAGTSDVADVELRHELLERLVIAEGKKMRQTLSDQRRLRIELVLDEASACHARRDMRETMEPVNKAAYRVERGCAHVRQCVKDVQLAVEGISDAHLALEKAGDAALFHADAALAVVVDIERLVGAWYDEADAHAGVRDTISFGEGVDFSLPEDEFVKTWGSAIDAFYASRSWTSGAIPLQGYGRAMAASAWQHHIDPRLCAAVSIVESSGGQACIRPFNAWGWGAADSDPYGLAVEWGSFEEAIEAWHEGMVTSTSGLAMASTVSALGAVYCSSPAWGATVIEQMELISGFVR